MQNTKKLTDWAVTPVSAFSAPEMGQVYRVYGTRADGKCIRSGPIVRVLDCTTVRTWSGSEYELTGAPHDAYMGDIENPLADIKESIRIQCEIGIDPKDAHHV